MKTELIFAIAFMMLAPFSSAYASWHWSSDYKVCGTEVIKKGEKCDLHSEDKKGDISSQPVNTIEKELDEATETCKNGLVPIIKKTTNSLNCVKESSFEKLIQRGWGKSP